MKRFLITTLSFLFILFILDRFFLLFRPNETNLFVKIAKEKLEIVSPKISNKKKPNTLIVGSSHAQFAISTEVIDKKLKSSSINLAYGGGANTGIQLTILKKLISEKNVTPNLIIYGIDIFSLTEEPYYSDKFIKYLFKESNDITDLLKSNMFFSYFKLYGRFIPRYINQIKTGNYAIPYFNSDASLDLKMFNTYEKYEISEGGWVKGYGLLNKLYIGHPEATFNLNQKAQYELDAYVDLCKINNITLVFIQIPEHDVCLKWKKKYDDFDLWMNQFVSKHNLTYWDFNNSQSFPTTTDSLFFDSDHLNKTGAELFTLKLADKLKSAKL
jgi:hypothetical protein